MVAASTYKVIPQGRCGRLLASSGVEGLYTEGLLTCAAIILCARDRSRISLIHADTFLNWDNIVAEIAWVGADCEKTLLFKDADDFGKVLSEHKDVFNLKQLHPSFFSLSISKTGKVIGYYPLAAGLPGPLIGGRGEALPSLEDHPNAKSMHAFYMINGLVHKSLFRDYCTAVDLDNLFVIFDDSGWQAPKQHDRELSPFALTKYKYLEGITELPNLDSVPVNVKNAIAQMWLESGAFNAITYSANYDRLLPLSLFFLRTVLDLRPYMPSPAPVSAASTAVQGGFTAAAGAGEPTMSSARTPNTGP